MEKFDNLLLKSISELVRTTSFITKKINKTTHGFN